jgi:hypothetical protein
MLGSIVLAATVLALLIIIAKPKLGVILLWPMLFLYPHYYMWQKQLLPLNIGIDDLFICAIFLIVLLRRNVMGGIPMRFGYSFWIAFTFFIILAISNLNSYLVVMTMTASDDFIKAALKGVITVLLAYSIINSIDDLNDLMRLIFTYCFCAALGAVLMILQQFFPEPLKIFTSPYYVFGLEHGAAPGPVGAFMNRNNAAIILGTASLIIVCTMQLESKYLRKWLRFTMIGVMVVAILFTRSRSGFLCLVIPLTIMGLMGRNKGPAIAFIVLGLIIFLALPTFRSALFERFSGRGAGEGNVGFWAPIAMRWQGILNIGESVTLRRLLFGESDIVDTMFNRLYPHNAYLGTILNYGIGGTIWIIVLVAVMLRKSKIMKEHPDLVISSVGVAIRWCLVVFALYCVVGGLLGNYYVRYALFLLTAIAQRGAELAWDYQTWGYDELYTDNPGPIVSGEDYANANCDGTDPHWSAP